MGLLDQALGRQSLDLDSLSDEQCEAVVEALVAVVFADGSMSEAESLQFDRELVALPWTWRKSSTEKLASARRAREKIRLLEDPDVATDFVNSLAQNLPGVELREAVYRMCIAIELADGIVDPREVNLLGGIRQAFGLSEGRAQELTAQVRHDLEAV